MRKDLHNHTLYCDGRNTPEETVICAIGKGLDTVGILCHSYTFFDTSYCIGEDETEKFIAEVHALSDKYQGKIEVLCGVEQDCYSTAPTDGFDYVIGSVHYLRVGEDYVPVDETAAILSALCERCYGGDIYALCEDYYRTVGTVAEKTGCDIIGHFDLITKFQERTPLFDVNHPRYVAAWKAAADRLLRWDIPFELNYGAIARGYRTTPYPSEEIAAYIRRRGGRLIPSSDSHRAQDVAYGFENA